VTDESAPDRITLARQRLFSDAGVVCRGRNHHHELLAGIDEDRLSDLSSSEAILPSASAIPIARLTMDFAIECDTKRFAALRSY
jgi:hypothetical protein